MTATAEETRATARKLLARWRDRPDLFAVEVLGLRLWEGQRRILLSVAHNARVAVRSGHKIGKSTSAAVIALWWLCTRKRALVVLTSSSGRQVKEILWKELTKLHAGAKIAIGGVVPLDPGTGIKLPDGRAIYGFSTNKPERMAGVSGDELLFIVDEASGVGEEIFEAIEGNRAGGASLAMFSNPTQTSGTFFDAFHRKAEFYDCIAISSEEAAAVTPRIPGLATAEWIAEKQREWGSDSPIYAVRARGDFPHQAADSVVALADVIAAIGRHAENQDAGGGRLHIGIDVARFGDDETVLVARRGRRVLEIRTVADADGIQVAGVALEMTRAHGQKNERALVKVDVIGVGASVVDQLADKAVDVVGVNVSENADDPEKFARKRDQMWFGAAAWLRDGGQIPDDGKLQSELVAPRYTFDPRGRYKVQSKDEIRAALKRSPDRADALGLAVYEAAAHVRVGDIDIPDEPGRWGNDARGY